MDVLTIGIAGGSGSGKTTVANQIIDNVGRDDISIIQQDSFYKDLSHIPISKRDKHNFDHPSSIDFVLFKNNVEKLKASKDVDIPIYNFVTHAREKNTQRVFAKKVVVVEGILIYENTELRKHLDIKIFVETPADLRFIRRLTRDISERGRDIKSVIDQYMETVRPMHEAFVEPSREHADVIIPWQGYNTVAIDMVISKIKSRLV